jgi:hypothetical protein
MSPELLIAIGSLIVASANAIAIVLGAMKLHSTAANIQKIEIATNSMKDQLVSATAKGSLAQGIAQGRADLTAEQAVTKRGHRSFSTE